MAIVTRPIKSGSGTTEYVPNTLIIADEANGDFDTIYGDYDGNIDSTNVRAGSLTYDRLVLTNGIVNADINTAAGIVGTKLANNTITKTQLAIGATVSQMPAPVNVPAVFVVTTSDTILVDTGTFTSRNSPCILSGWASLYCVLGGASPNISINKLTVSIYGYNPTFGEGLIHALEVSASLASNETEEVFIPAVIPFSLVNNPGGLAGSGYRIKVRATVSQTSLPFSNWRTALVNAGFIQVTELS